MLVATDDALSALASVASLSVRSSSGPSAGDALLVVTWLMPHELRILLTKQSVHGSQPRALLHDCVRSGEQKYTVGWSVGARLHYLCSFGYIADKIFDALIDLVESPFKGINSEHPYQHRNRFAATENGKFLQPDRRFVRLLKREGGGRTSVTQMHKKYANHLLLSCSLPQSQINCTSDHPFAVLSTL